MRQAGEPQNCRHSDGDRAGPKKSFVSVGFQLFVSHRVPVDGSKVSIAVFIKASFFFKYWNALKLVMSDAIPRSNGKLASASQQTNSVFRSTNRDAVTN